MTTNNCSDCCIITPENYPQPGFIPGFGGLLLPSHSSVPSSTETLSMTGLAREKVYDNYSTSSTPTGPYSMHDLTQGGNSKGSGVSFESTNTDGPYEPDTSTPHAMSEWHGYDHDYSAPPSYVYAHTYLNVYSYDSNNNWTETNSSWPIKKTIPHTGSGGGSAIGWSQTYRICNWHPSYSICVCFPAASSHYSGSGVNFYIWNSPLGVDINGMNISPDSYIHTTVNMCVAGGSYNSTSNFIQGGYDNDGDIIWTYTKYMCARWISAPSNYINPWGQWWSTRACSA